MANKKLTRSTNKMLAGVCGGIAEFFDIDPTLIRVCYAALSVFSAAFPGLILYIILMLIMPVKDKNDRFEEAEVVK
jgi:phage shock protein PspC (stress-responsive transcriptional regulator)